MKKPIRIQFALNNRLLAEVVVEDLETAKKVSADFALAKLRVNSSAGGTIMQRRDSPKMWNVPVGGVINKDYEEYLKNHPVDIRD